MATVRGVAGVLIGDVSHTQGGTCCARDAKRVAVTINLVILTSKDLVRNVT